MAGKEYGKLAKRYAVAFLKSVEAEQGTSPGENGLTPAQSVAISLSDLRTLWLGNEEFSQSILNPMFDASDRLKALLEIARRLGVSGLGVRMIEVVFERERIAAFAQMSQAFSELADERAGVVPVTIEIAGEISDEEARSIEQRLCSEVEGKLRFSWIVKPEILAGMIVRYQGKVLDGSLSGRLERIEEQLMA